MRRDPNGVDFGAMRHDGRHAESFKSRCGGTAFSSDPGIVDQAGGSKQRGVNETVECRIDRQFIERTSDPSEFEKPLPFRLQNVDPSSNSWEHVVSATIIVTQITSEPPPDIVDEHFRNDIGDLVRHFLGVDAGRSVVSTQIRSVQHQEPDITDGNRRFAAPDIFNGVWGSDVGHQNPFSSSSLFFRTVSGKSCQYSLRSGTISVSIISLYQATGSAMTS